MNDKILWIMVGAPGAGKSTYLKKNVKNGVVVSRDEIRFSLLQDNESYFKNEKKVFKIFASKIKEAFKTNDNVYADATHLNAASRTKLLNALSLDDDNIKINILFFNTSLETCLERNTLRSGNSFVPETAIRRMFDSLDLPTFKEDKYTYNRILVIFENDKIMELEEVEI